ncbi:MAG: hypothetical protein C0582_04605 [Alphaproteobacteria bacterium]|nr:MAG: hypothetical protein C0582_04605 [Alphaproteobacteria bacterium]
MNSVAIFFMFLLFLTRPIPAKNFVDPASETSQSESRRAPAQSSTSRVNERTPPYLRLRRFPPMEETTAPSVSSSPRRRRQQQATDSARRSHLRGLVGQLSDQGARSTSVSEAVREAGYLPRDLTQVLPPNN